MTNPKMAGQVVLVTGGARGMGRLWALHFARDGAKLALWDLDRGQLDKTAAELRGLGAEVFIQVVDVTDNARVYAAAEELQRDFGVLDVLVNNAGIVHAGRFLETPDASLEATIRVNLTAMMIVTKAFLPAMIAKGRGRILNVSSASGFIGVPFMPAYVASKWGVLGLTDSLRLEMELLGHKGITFSVFCPSYVDTGMFSGVKAPRLVPLLSPDEAVDRGYCAFLRDAYVIREPFMVKLTPGLRTLLPTFLFDRVSSLLGVTTSMERWKGHSK